MIMFVVGANGQFYVRTNKDGDALWSLDIHSACYFDAYAVSYTHQLADRLGAQVLPVDINTGEIIRGGGDFIDLLRCPLFVQLLMSLV